MKNENKNKTENVKGRMEYSNQWLICEIDKAVASFHWEHTDIMLVPRVHYFIIDAWVASMMRGRCIKCCDVYYLLNDLKRE